MWLSCSPLSRFAVVNWQMPLVWADKGRSTKPRSGFVPSRGEKNNFSIYHGEPCEIKFFFWNSSVKWQFFTAGTTLPRKVWVDGPMKSLVLSVHLLKSCHSKFSMHTGWSAASTWRSCSNWKMTWRMTWTQWGYSLSVVRCCDIGALHNCVLWCSSGTNPPVYAEFNGFVVKSM